MKTIRFEAATFTPAEAEAITGIDGAEQRNLRRHGYLPKPSKGGWTHHELPEAAKLLLIAISRSNWLPPSASSEIADSAAALVLAFAQEIPDAIADPFDLAGGEKPIKVSPAGVARRFLILADGKIDFAKHMPAEIDTAVTIIDLKALAARLVSRAREPLWTVVLESEA